MELNQLTENLKAAFPADQIRWRVGSTMGPKEAPTKGMALGYVDARQVMDRLDMVVGPENWQCRHAWGADGRVCCEVGIWIPGRSLMDQDTGEVKPLEPGRWVWKSDGAGETGYEGDKGVFSDAFKRACVHWGIARYLYTLPNIWMDLDGKRYFSKAVQGELSERLNTWQSKEGHHVLEIAA